MLLSKVTGVEEQRKLLSLKLRLVNGDLSIDSELQRGTIIHARVPFNSDSESRRAAAEALAALSLASANYFVFPQHNGVLPFVFLGPISVIIGSLPTTL